MYPSTVYRGCIVPAFAGLLALSTIILYQFSISNSIDTNLPCPSLKFHPPKRENLLTISGCSWRFLRYIPSAWETYWINNIDGFRHDICGRLTRQTDKTIPFMEAVLKWGHYLKRAETTHEDSNLTALELFSRLDFVRSCNVTREIQSEFIEPLFGMLRDPFSVCEDLPRGIPTDLIQPTEAERIQSKFWTLNGIHAPVQIRGERVNQTEGGLNSSFGSLRALQAPRRILFDLGSNLFGSWGGNKAAYSTAFFHSMFNAQNLPFNRIFAYEYERLDPHAAWEVVPDDAMDIYALINHGVESDPESKFNPWNLLRKIALPDDWVVVKLDIDSPGIERELMRQLLKDTSLSDLVDEMYFEHHVYIREMQPYWGIDSTSNETLVLSYRWFTKLREKGVRMHSWP